jgi:16S rRNA (guanine527-N7)-methyltransferase
MRAAYCKARGACGLRRSAAARYNACVSAFDEARDAASIDRLAAALGCKLEPGARAALAAYVALVASWNRKLNLTAAREAQAQVEVLLGDACVLCVRELVAEAARVIDVGSGAGAPIIPLLLLRPDVSAECVEPLGKRATFLRTASARLGLLSRMRVHETRLDLDRPQAFGAADLACSRATFAPERWLEVGLSLAPCVLVMTASSAPPAPPSGVTLEAERDYTLPFSGAPRRAALYRRG